MIPSGRASRATALRKAIGIRWVVGVMTVVAVGAGLGLIGLPAAIGLLHGSPRASSPHHVSSPAQAAAAWTYTTNASVDSSPAVVRGVVYVGSGDGNVYALNAATGAVRWSHDTGGVVNSSPAVINGTVYVGSDNSEVYALNAATGS